MTEGRANGIVVIVNGAALLGVILVGAWWLLPLTLMGLAAATALAIADA